VFSFDQGAKDLLNDIQTAAKMQGWKMHYYQIEAERQVRARMASATTARPML
jgi:hypothetical protein